MAGKHAKVHVDPRPAKTARHGTPDEAARPISWRFSHCDREGPFAWSIGSDAKFREIIEKLKELEHHDWNELKQAGSHLIQCADLCVAAQKRLAKIKRDDVDELMSLRLSGSNRVWCIPSLGVMQVLWWDERHEVFPVLKDKADRIKAKRR